MLLFFLNGKFQLKKNHFPHIRLFSSIFISIFFPLHNRLLKYGFQPMLLWDDLCALLVVELCKVYLEDCLRFHQEKNRNSTGQKYNRAHLSRIEATSSDLLKQTNKKVLA